MKGYLSILIVLSIAGCTYLQPSNLGAVDACKLSSVDDTTFCKSINTADSIWINPLNKIVNSRILERDSLLYVYFKYHQNVSGHEVTGCWMPFDRHSETGYIVLNFCDTSSKKSFQYTSTEAYTNFNLYQVVFSEDFKGHHDGDVYYFEYVSPCYNDSWQKYNRFRYYSPEMGIYISSDPIGLVGGFNTYAYVKDTNTWVDVLGLSGELVYQLIRDNKVVYYGITSRTALERMAEHGKTKVFDNMEILADGLTHDQARSIEGALIRQRLKERADDWSDFDSIKARLDKSGLDNRNRGRIKERWTSENPLDDLRDKIYKKPKKVKVGCKS